MGKAREYDLSKRADQHDYSPCEDWGGVDDSADCEDQVLVPTEFCHAWACHKVPLVRDSFGYWKCPKCSGSYGKAAKG